MMGKPMRRRVRLRR
jgi:hypothetical protein